MDEVKFVYNRANKTIKKEKKIKETNELIKEWRCQYCNKKNSTKIQFCSNCLMNK